MREFQIRQMVFKLARKMALILPLSMVSHVSAQHATNSMCELGVCSEAEQANLAMYLERSQSVAIEVPASWSSRLPTEFIRWFSGGAGAALDVVRKGQPKQSPPEKPSD